MKISRGRRAHLIEVASENERQQLQRIRFFEMSPSKLLMQFGEMLARGFADGIAGAIGERPHSVPKAFDSRPFG